MKPPNAVAAGLAVAVLAGALLAAVGPAAQAANIQEVARDDLRSGAATLAYGGAYGITTCWKSSVSQATMWVLDEKGSWKQVSQDGTLGPSASCTDPSYPNMAVNAWTVNVSGSQTVGVRKNALVLAWGWRSVAPTAQYDLVNSGPKPDGQPSTWSWNALEAGKITLFQTGTFTLNYPRCDSANLYALDQNSTWQQVASRCKDPWTVGFAGSGPVGAAKGAMLLSVGKSAPLYSYVVAAVQ